MKTNKDEEIQLVITRQNLANAHRLLEAGACSLVVTALGLGVSISTVDIVDDEEFRKLYRKAKNKGLESNKGGGVS